MTISFNLVNQYVNTAQHVDRKEIQSLDKNQAAATPGRDVASSDSSVQISESARQLSESDDVYILNTSHGDRAVDFATFFEPPNGPVDLSSIPLLLPTGANVAALQDHISKVFPGFLQRHDIPEAPSSIKFDNEGQMVLPKDYPYADQLRTALNEEPNMMRELSTANALASHVAALKEPMAFNEEYSKAKTQAEMDAIINKYRHLFDDNRRSPDMAMNFSKEGNLNITADSESVV